MQEWLDRQISCYQKWNFGLWSVILINRRYWHNGYATEAAKACKRYAFEELDAEEVCSIIRDTNTASKNVAIRNGMTVRDSWIKHYKGVDMLHYRYVVIR